jgi:prephenate dehydrogenase
MHVTVIGTGLIGCSLGLALRKAGHFVTGVDKNEFTFRKPLGGVHWMTSAPWKMLLAKLTWWHFVFLWMPFYLFYRKS